MTAKTPVANIWLDFFQGENHQNKDYFKPCFSCFYTLYRNMMEPKYTFPLFAGYILKLFLKQAIIWTFSNNVWISEEVSS